MEIGIAAALICLSGALGTLAYRLGVRDGLRAARVRPEPTARAGEPRGGESGGVGHAGRHGERQPAPGAPNYQENILRYDGKPKKKGGDAK